MRLKYIFYKIFFFRCPSGVYRILNTKNDRYYIGGSETLEKRFKEHTHYLKKEKHYSKIMGKDYKKQKGKGFKFEVLLYCSNKDTKFYEQRFLDYHFKNNSNLLYNKNRSAYNNMGTRHSEETKRKISISKKGIKGRKHSKESKRKMSLARKGIKFSEEHKRNLSMVMKGKTSSRKGKKLSEETKRKISISKKGKISPMKGRNLSEESKEKIVLALRKYWREKKQMNEKNYNSLQEIS